MKNYIFVAFLDPVLHDLAVEAPNSSFSADE
jgi:hypothetical protein